MISVIFAYYRVNQCNLLILASGYIFFPEVAVRLELDLQQSFQTFLIEKIQLQIHYRSFAETVYSFCFSSVHQEMSLFQIVTETKRPLPLHVTEK